MRGEVLDIGVELESPGGRRGSPTNSFSPAALIFDGSTNPAHPKHIGSIDPNCNVSEVVKGKSSAPCWRTEELQRHPPPQLPRQRMRHSPVGGGLIRLGLALVAPCASAKQEDRLLGGPPHSLNGPSSLRRLRYGQAPV